MSQKYSLGTWQPHWEESLTLLDNRVVHFKVPEDVTPLEAARFCLLNSLIAFGGRAVNMNVAKTIKAYGLERLMRCNDEHLEYIELPE